MEAFPLQWPMGYTKTVEQKPSRFKITLKDARDLVKDEVGRMKGTDLIISSNVPLNANGDLRADWPKFNLDNTGVAVYFKNKGELVCLCCDHYKGVHENLYAVGRTIAALRQIERDGVSDFLKKAFAGFKALPETTIIQKSIWEILGLEKKPANRSTVETAYRVQVKRVHPDVAGGSHEAFLELKNAYEKALSLF